MLRLFSVCLLLSTSLAFSADEEAENIFDYGWFGSGMLSYVDDDGDRHVNDGLGGFHLGIGKGFNGGSALEFNIVGSSLSGDADLTRQRQAGFGVDYLRRFGNDTHISPYALVGAGYMKTKYDSLIQSDFDGGTGSVGLGIFIPLSSSKFFLRTEIRARKDFSSDGQIDYLLSFGLHISADNRVIPPPDSDNDSISNADDRCPGTPANVPVDRFGCAIK